MTPVKMCKLFTWVFEPIVSHRCGDGRIKFIGLHQAHRHSSTITTLTIRPDSEVIVLVEYNGTPLPVPPTDPEAQTSDNVNVISSVGSACCVTESRVGYASDTAGSSVERDSGGPLRGVWRDGTGDKSPESHLSGVFPNRS